MKALALAVPLFLLVQCNIHKPWSELLSISTLISALGAIALIARATEFLCVSFQMKDKNLEILIAVFTGFAIAKYLDKSSLMRAGPTPTPLRRVIVTTSGAPNGAEDPNGAEEPPNEVEEPEEPPVEVEEPPNVEDIYPPPESEESV